jgi:hypothetical protein
MSALAHVSRRGVLSAAAWYCLLTEGAAQTFNYSIPGNTYQGTLADASRGGVVIESDGSKFPVRLDRATQITIYGVGDAGFLRPGMTVTVSGEFHAERQSIEESDISVHLNPRLTARQGVTTMNTDSRRLSIKGVVTSLEPLAIKTIDLVRVQVKSGVAGLTMPPTAAGKLLMVKLRNPNPQQVTLLLGNNLGLAQAGDPVSVFIARERPGVAYSLNVTRTEPLDSTKLSPAGKSVDSKSKGKADEESPQPGKAEAGAVKPEEATNAPPPPGDKSPGASTPESPKSEAPSPEASSPEVPSPAAPAPEAFSSDTTGQRNSAALPAGDSERSAFQDAA